MGIPAGSFRVGMLCLWMGSKQTGSGDQMDQKNGNDETHGVV